MKISLKELKESHNSLALIKQYLSLKNKKTEDYDSHISECRELIRIFSASIKTAKANMHREKVNKMHRH